MKLIIIYGPPAVGKLTIAQALAGATGFKLLHNHLFGDLIGSLFDRGTPAANKLNQQIRTLTYKAAAENNIGGLITTFVYHHDQEERERECICDYIKAIGQYGGEVFLVKLSCNLEALRRRVIDSSRLGTKKITSVERLEKELGEKDLTSELTGTGAKTLHIDSTKLEPHDVVSIIMLRFNLKTK